MRPPALILAALVTTAGLAPLSQGLGTPEAQALRPLTQTTGPADLPASASPSSEIARAEHEIVVRYEDGTTSEAIAAAEARAGAELVREVPELGVRVLRVGSDRAAATEALLRDPSVAGAEPHTVFEITDVTPVDPRYADQWGARAIGAPALWGRTLGDPRIVIAVVDTGVDPGRAELGERVVAGFNAIALNGETFDPHGHGTSVAAVAAAGMDDGVGIAGYCPRCRVMPIKAFDASGRATALALSGGITWAVDHGARIINVSAGSPERSALVEAAVRYAQQRGALVIASAGNSGKDMRFYPAGLDGVVSVAGVDARDVLYGWSNRGDWVTVAAPGCNAAPSTGGIFCGTSSAAPVVSGIAALLWSAHLDRTPGDIATALTAGARPMAGVSRGRLEAGRALSALTGQAPATAAAPVTGAAPGVPGAPVTSPPPTRTLPTALPRESTRPMATLVRREVLRPTRPNARVDVPVRADGTVSAHLTWKGGALEAVLIDPSGREIARRQGNGSITLSAPAARAGTHRLLLMGSRSADVQVSISYPR